MKNNKFFKIIKGILNTVVTVFVILFLLVVCLQRFSNNEIHFFNYRMFTVASGSMAPDYNIGDVLITKEVAAKEIKVGDSISYLGRTGTFANKVITHQVIEIEKDIDGNYVFHTKGIANVVEDPLVYEEQIYGVVKYKSVALSFIYKIVNTKYGMFIFIILPIFYIIGSEMLSFMLEKEEERRGIKKQEQEDEEETEEKPKKKKTTKKNK